ncbi:hypothetical protein P0F65_02820 [Sphingomonas sp. I4]
MTGSQHLDFATALAEYVRYRRMSHALGWRKMGVTSTFRIRHGAYLQSQSSKKRSGISKHRLPYAIDRSARSVSKELNAVIGRVQATRAAIIRPPGP